MLDSTLLYNFVSKHFNRPRLLNCSVLGTSDYSQSQQQKCLLAHHFLRLVRICCQGKMHGNLSKQLQGSAMFSRKCPSYLWQHSPCLGMAGMMLLFTTDGQLPQSLLIDLPNTIEALLVVEALENRAVGHRSHQASRCHISL